MTSPNPERGMRTTCPDCVAAGLRMKEQGFRNWRTGYACDEHSWLSIEEAFAALGYVPDEDDVRRAAREMGIPYVGPDGFSQFQPDLFASTPSLERTAA